MAPPNYSGRPSTTPYPTDKLTYPNQMMQIQTPRNQQYDKRQSTNNNYLTEMKTSPSTNLKQLLSLSNNKVLNPEKENFMTGDDRREIEIISI